MSPAIDEGAAVNEPTATGCPYCGEPTDPDRGRMTLWLGERLVVLEGVPARVCRGCGETFYDEAVLARVERLQGGAPERPEPVRVVETPVYAWSDL